MIISNSHSGQSAQVASSSAVSKQNETGSAVNGFESVMDKTKSNDQLPLEALALPSWYNSYLPEATMLNGGLNHGYHDLCKDLTKDNILTDDERGQLKSYLDNDPFHQDELRKREFRAKYQGELSEYGDTLNTYFQESLKENGVNSQRDYYGKVILDKGTSEKIHESMKSRLESNPRVLELMEILGTTL